MKSLLCAHFMKPLDKVGHVILFLVLLVVPEVGQRVEHGGGARARGRRAVAAGQVEQVQELLRAHGLHCGVLAAYHCVRC